MGAIADIVIPVFCLIALGYTIARTGYLKEAAGDGLTDFVFRVAVPILLMKSIATAQFDAAGGWLVWIAFVATYFSGVVVVWTAAMVLISRVFGRDQRASMISGVAAGFANLVLMGIPLVQRAFGDEGLQTFFILLSVHLPVMMIISTFGMEFAARADGVGQTPISPATIAASLARNLLKNPLIVGILIGLVWRLSGFGLSGVAEQVLDLLSATTGPLALIALGVGLTKYGIRGNLAPAMALSVLSLLVMPGIIWLTGSFVADLPTHWIAVAVVGAASPTGVNAYLFATHFKTGQGLATNTIVLSTLGSIITLPFWLALVVL
ncbi:MAG: AEC family transporter [Ahrensia sp.]|nr:AEC family transporter [Ahrensia sp.]